MESTSQQLSESVMDADLYRLILESDISGFDTAIDCKKLNVLSLRYATHNKTVLHIAASSGQVEMVNHILTKWSHQLMVKENSEGDLPIHSALKSRKLENVKALTSWLRGQEKERVEEVMKWRNKNGEKSTPLHVALEYSLDEETVKELVDLYPQACYENHVERICPLYMAIKESKELVKHMLDKLERFKGEALASLSQGKSLLHAVVHQHKRENSCIEILKMMLSFDGKELIKLTDGQKWTALSYAVCNCSLEIVKVFQERVPHNAFTSNRDENVTFPIHVAAHRGDTDIIDSLVSTGSGSQVDAKYQNIFHVAALTKNSNIVSHLLTKLPKDEVESLINQKDKDGNTPLHLATREKFVEVVRILIQDERVNIKLLDKEELTVEDSAKKMMVKNPEDKEVQKLNLMFERARKGLKNHEIDNDLYPLLFHKAVEEIDKIISEKGVQFQDLISLEDGNNVLHFIAYMDNPKPLVDHLIANQDCTALMEHANFNGDLPIHLAAKAGKLQNLKTLFKVKHLSEKEMCKIQNLDKNTALHEAVLNGHVETAKYLFQKHKTAAYFLNKDNICPLFLVIKNWKQYKDLDEEMIKETEGKEDVQKQLKDAKSIVHMAILAKRIEVLKLIIETAPCILNSFDSRGRSPLSYAAYIGNVDGVSHLLKHDSNLEFKRDKDKDGSFPIHYAAKGGRLKAVKLFTLSETLVNNNNQNVLHVAAEKGRLSIVDYLLKQPNFKELLNAGDGDGNTPLHLAAMGFHCPVLHHLIIEGKRIDVNSTNKELLTPKDLIERHPKYQCPEDESFDRQSECIKKLLKRAKGKNSSVREKGSDEKGEEKAKEDKNSSSKPSTWQKANMLLVVAAIMIGTSYNAVTNPPGGYNKETGLPVLSSLSSNAGFQYEAYSRCIYCAFIFAVIAAQLLLAAAMFEKISKVLLLCGSIFIYVGLLSMTVSCIAGIYAIDKAVESKLKSSFVSYIAQIVFLFFVPPLFVIGCIFIYSAPKYLSSFFAIRENVTALDDVDI